LPGYDYRRGGYYFVTICTKDRMKWFGEVLKGRMILNRHGEIVRERWLWLGKRYPHVRLDEYVVMPNHLHGILIIKPGVGNGRDRSRQTKSLSSVIGAFKATSCQSIRQDDHPAFQWQRSFYDHIIRSGESLKKIRHYIKTNPATWREDEENVHKT